MEINKYIDHTLLKADLTKEELDKIISEAKEYNFKTVCIPPSFVLYAKQELKGTDVLVATVIGFPLGYNETKIKIAEAELAIKNGADEIDMVINISKAKDGDFKYIESEISQIKKTIKTKTLKVIIETALLSENEKEKVIQAVIDAKADFLKTSTGFSTSGAKVEDVKLMKQMIPNWMGIKAAGGIKTKSDALKMIDSGATRIGTSNGVAIVTDTEGKNKY